MKRLVFVLAVIAVMMTGCNKSTKPTKKNTLIGTWKVLDEYLKDISIAVKFDKEGVFSIGKIDVQQGFQASPREKAKYTVDYGIKQFKIYKPSGEVEDVATFEFISSEKVKITDDKGKVNYIERYK